MEHASHILTNGRGWAD